jgi:adenylate kinase family enzyme
VTSGNYSKARDLIWGRADTLVWLDYPLGLVLFRLLRRALQRITTQEELWAGNRETWRGQFFSRDSLFIYAWRTHPRKRKEYPSIAATYPNLTLLRFQSPRQVQHWLDEVRPVYN